METIDTIINSYHQLVNANVSWSSNAGMVWLTPMVIGFTTIVIWGMSVVDRQSRKRALYREAQVVAQDRLARWERRGYQEFIQTL